MYRIWSRVWCCALLMNEFGLFDGDGEREKIVRIMCDV